MSTKRFPSTLALLAGCALILPAAAETPAEAEARRRSFEEAIQKVEAAEKARTASAQSGDDAAAAARIAQEKLRAAAAAQAAAAPAIVSDGDQKMAKADAFVAAVEKKSPAAPRPAPPKGGVPVEGNGPAPGGVIGEVVEPRKKKAAQETIIDAEELIFDGSGKFGKAFQVVVFEKNVRLQHPQFLMDSDKLTAFFKEQPEPDPAAVGAAGVPAEDAGGDKLERAIATGREVVVTKKMEDGEPQIAKARKATYFADREEVLLEIWPQVQRGNNLVMAKSKDTVIILKGEEMIVKGPVRAKLVGKGAMGGAAAAKPQGKKGKESDGLTVIDASRGAVFNRPSRVAGHKEIFFDGAVSVADPGFDMVDGDSLTAYTKTNSKTGEWVLSSAVMNGKKVQVQERTGKERQGNARTVAFYPSSGDIKLKGYPAIYDGIQWKKIDSPSGELFLNEKSGNVKSKGGRSKMTFTPGMKPPA